ncbi:MAG: hypothetical protein WCG48_01045 [Candidatus Berkelbacteria bacterium]
MEPEKNNGGFGSSFGSDNSKPNTTSPMPIPEKKTTSSKDSVLEDLQFEVSKESTNWPVIILWITTAFSLVVVGGLYFMNRSLDQDIAAKTNERNDVVQSINSSDYAAVEKQAKDFKLAATKLIDANNKTVSVGTFLDGFYLKVNSSIQVKNLALASDGTFSFDGVTKNYRSIADESLTLMTWNKLSGVTIGSVSNDLEGKNSSFKFTISGKASFATGEAI